MGHLPNDSASPALVVTPEPPLGSPGDGRRCSAGLCAPQWARP